MHTALQSRVLAVIIHLHAEERVLEASESHETDRHVLHALLAELEELASAFYDDLLIRKEKL